MSTPDIALLLIDMQNSFMDHLRPKGMELVPYYNCDRERMILPDGTEFLSALPVPGALNDVDNTVELIKKYGRHIRTIVASLDSHRTLHIAQGVRWEDKDGNEPVRMLTCISHDDIVNGIWTPRHQHVRVPRRGNRTVRQIALDYTEALEKKGNKKLQIWNEHCLISTWGQNLHPKLFAALREWETTYFRSVIFVPKGDDLFTEHYGIWEAEVPDTDEPSTMLKTIYLELLAKHRETWVGGEARGHCVQETVKQTVDHFGVDALSKIKILSDCMSDIPAVPGVPELDFPAIADAFFAKVEKQGVVITDTKALLS